MRLPANKETAVCETCNFKQRLVTSNIFLLLRNAGVITAIGVAPDGAIWAPRKAGCVAVPELAFGACVSKRAFKTYTADQPGASQRCARRGNGTKNVPNGASACARHMRCMPL